MPETRHRAAPETGDAWLVPILTDQGLITRVQLDELAAEPAIWSAVVTRGWTSDDAVAGAVASAFRLTRANLTGAEARVARFPKRWPASTACCR